MAKLGKLPFDVVSGALDQVLFRTADMTEDARLLYLVGGLVCNDVGFVRQADLQAAMGDPAVVAAAMEILNKARRRAAARSNTGKQKKQRRGR